MRSVLMILGVLLHAANVYMVDGQWELHDASATSPVFGGIAGVIGSFRMPAFFLIAGFFAQMMLVRHGGRYFVRHRIRRLVIPFLMTAALLNSLQLWLQDRVPVLSANSAALPDSLANVFISGRWLQHLWFLVILLIFSAVAVPLSKLLIVRDEKENATERPQRNVLSLVLVLGPISEMLAHSVLHGVRFLLDGPFVFGLLDPARLLTYSPFFVLGLWLYSNPKSMQSFCQVGLPTVASVIAAFFIHRWLRTNDEGRMHSVVEWGYSGLIHWLGCHLCFSFFWKVVRGPSDFWKYCSDASYTVYLTHHLLVVVVAGGLLNIDWSPFTKFATVCCVVSLAAVLIHELMVRRIKLLSFLFNGK